MKNRNYKNETSNQNDCNLLLNLLDNKYFKNFLNKYSPELKLPTKARAGKHFLFVRKEVKIKACLYLKNQLLRSCIYETANCKIKLLLQLFLFVY